MLAPDDFDDDPYRHVTNQAGHAVFVGMPGAFLILALGWPAWLAPIIVAVVYAAAWEWGVQRWLWRREFDWRDSVMDTACSMAGASIVAGLLHSLTAGAICFGAFALVVFWGGIRRWKP